jgi:hypothetical protein
MPKTSYSEIKLARKCAKAWYYRYVENLKRKRPSRPAFIGTILHEMIDVWIKARILPNYMNDPWKILEKYKREYKELFKSEKEEFGDVPLTAEKLFEGYLRRWRKDGLTYERSEAPIVTDLTKDIRLIGFIDAIAIDKSGRRFAIDHKFHRVLPGPEDRFADIQTLLYFWAWNQSHPKAEHLDGVLWDYGRMKMPAVPELLKNGELTKRANIDTDQHTYLEAIEEHGLNRKKYQDILDKLEGKERTFFERVPLPAPPKKMVESVVEDARATAVIRKTLREIAPRSQSGFNCRTCDYRSVCEAEVRGLDHQFVRKRDYIIEEHQGDWGDAEEDLA